MSKWRKGLLIGVAGIALVVIGVGCGTTTESEQPPAATTTPADEPTTASTPAPVEEEAPDESVAQENAREAAESYLDTQAFSRKGLIEQLEYEGYSTKDATYAVGAIAVDWKEQAAKSAASYLDTQAFSRSGLIEQLEYEGFTHRQAVYGVNQTGL
jgi:uncharacterized lipoprotein YddW (UPF0748 family)